DYEMIATMALLETGADRRETILRQIYEVNRQTIEDGKKGNPSAILVPVEAQHDAREAAHLVDKLQMAGVEVFRSDAAFDANGTRFAFDYKGADSAIAINRLLKDGARVAFDAPSHIVVTGAQRDKVDQLARDLGLTVQASPEPRTQNQNREPRTRTRNQQNQQNPNHQNQNQNPQNENA